MSSKHVELLSNVNPFLDDPYDFVGSFVAILTPIFGGMNLIRVFLISLYDYKGENIYVIRTNIILGLGILFAVIVDSLAVLAEGFSIAFSYPLLILYVSLSVFTFLSLIILAISFRQKYNLNEKLTDYSLLNYLLSKNKFLSKINITKTPIKTSLLSGLLVGISIALIQYVGEGYGSNLRETLILSSIFIAIPTIVIYTFLILSGSYLGIWSINLKLNIWSYVLIGGVFGGSIGALFILTADSNIYFPLLTFLGIVMGYILGKYKNKKEI